jgi:hypothetical protein
MKWLDDLRERNKVKRETEEAARISAYKEKLFRIRIGLNENDPITMSFLREAYKKYSWAQAFAENDAFQAGWKGGVEESRAGSRVAGTYKKVMKEIQEWMVKLLPEGIKKEVIHLFWEGGFNVLEFLDADPWYSSIVEVIIEPSHYVKHGTPYPKLSDTREPLPISGAEILIWLFESSSVGDGDYLENIGKAVTSSIKSGAIIGHPIDIEDEGFLGMRLMMPFMGNDSVRQFKPLLMIYNEVDGGQEFIEKCIREADARAVKVIERFK